MGARLRSFLGERMLRAGSRILAHPSLRRELRDVSQGRAAVQSHLLPISAVSLEQRRDFLPGPVVRLIAQVAVAAAGVVSRAFMQAYQEAAASALRRAEPLAAGRR